MIGACLQRHGWRWVSLWAGCSCQILFMEACARVLESEYTCDAQSIYDSYMRIDHLLESNRGGPEKFFGPLHWIAPRYRCFALLFRRRNPTHFTAGALFEPTNWEQAYWYIWLISRPSVYICNRQRLSTCRIASHGHLELITRRQTAFFYNTHPLHICKG